MENIRRMNTSADRLCLPLLPEDLAMEALTAFVRMEEAWTPSAPGTSLYLRPFMFGNDESLGVHTVHNARFIIIASPVGSYYKEGINPVKIMIEDEDVRAVKGGTGYTKCGGNYAASNRAGERAAQKGYSQVLWLDGIHRKYIEEVGAMNVMFKIAGEIVTPMLSGFLMDRMGMTVLFPYATVFVALAFVTMGLVKHGDNKIVAKKGLEALDIDD